MKNKQLLYLFFCNFVVFLIGGGLVPLLPLYATQFGASSTVAGIYLAIIYLAIAAGTMLTGWLAERLTRKGLFIGAGVLGVPALILHGYVTALWQAVLLTAIVWFCGGIGTALVSVFTGLYADNKGRGKSFGLMFLARPLGSVIGGLTAGQLVEWQGYPLLFIVLGTVWVGWPLLAILSVDYQPTTAPTPAASVAEGARLRPGRAFYLLLLVALLSTTVVYIGRLGTSLSMQTLGFSPSAVASTSTAGGLVAIPVTLLIGVLSDRLGRKGLLMLSYVLAVGGVLMLSTASQLWHFWLTMILLLVVTSANGSVAAAFATDLLGPKALSRGLPWLSAMTWTGGIVGFAGAGYAMDTLGATTLYFLAAALGVMAATLLGLLPRQRHTVSRAWLRWRITNIVPVHKKV